MRTIIIKLGIASLLFGAPGLTSAATFTLRDLQGIYNGRVSYGTLYRLEDRDPDLIAIASDGKLPSANVDDGNLNYSKGLVSSTVRATAETLLLWRNFGAYVRGSAFYDFKNQSNDPQRTAFDSDAEQLVGSDVELQESYVSWRPGVGGMPILLRVGQQIVNWSETTFVRDGLDVINPVNLVTVLQPASTREDLRVPQRMVWAAANITETFSLEAYYQFEWEPVVVPPVGWFFSNNDGIGGEGLQSWMYGNGQISDLGTDLDQHFQLPAGTLGFDPDFQRLPGLNRDKASDTGQYGVALVGILPDSNATRVGVHYIHYHSRLPLVMARTGDAAAVAATAEPLVAGRATALESIYLEQGRDPVEAALLGRDTAEQLTLSSYANEASFFVSYPEDIDLFGLSFSTSARRTGTLFAGEISHHRNYPFQLALNPLLQTVFSPVLFDPAVGATPLGNYGPGQEIGGFVRLKRTMATLEAAQIYRGQLGADQLLLSADVSWSGVHNIPRGSEPRLTSDDEDSWGYRVQLAASYSSVLGGINLTPYVAFSHDIDGTTPAPISTFIEDRKSLSLGIRGSLINRIVTELRYTTFVGGGRDNLLRDRDYLRFQVSYYL
jgi:Protein of unknown function (DUF1302)